MAAKLPIKPGHGFRSIRHGTCRQSPVLLKGEIVYESDTGRHKLGDGTTAWNALAYASDVEKYPHCGGRCRECFYVKPRPTLRIRFLNAAASEYSTTRMHESESQALRSCARPAEFKLVQDRFSRDELSWTSTLDPIPFESDKADKSGWLPVISVKGPCSAGG